MEILAKIERAHFRATDADIETMARQRQAGDVFSAKAAGTYLRALVASTAHAVGGETAHLSRRRGRAASALHPDEVAQHLTALDGVNQGYYAAVLRAVVSPDIAKVDGLPQPEQTRRALERNRRTNYARTAMVAVRAYITAGRDVRDLEPAAVSKESLREVAERFNPPPKSISAARLLRAATRASARIIEEAEELARIDVEGAEKMLNALMDELSATLERIRSGEMPASTPESGATTIVTNAIRDAALRPRAAVQPRAARARAA